MMNTRVEMNEEMMEQVNGGDPRDWQSPADPIIDGVIYVGGKTVDGAKWCWNKISSLFD